ncbi:MAG: DoxX family membrane protein [Desulfitobacteriaceae bacterium]|nr:DoxX family membrane protein [Desulfitobacteriaceae bacterium]
MYQKIFGNKWFTLISRILVGAILTLGSVLKLPDIKMNSVHVVYEYGILPIEPIDFAAIFGYILPFAELAVGLALILGVLTRLASVGGGLLGLSFVIGEGVVLLQGRDLDCGCFPGLMGTMVSQTIYLSAAIIAFAGFVFLSNNRNFLTVDNIIKKKYPRLPQWIKTLMG